MTPFCAAFSDPPDSYAACTFSAESSIYETGRCYFSLARENSLDTVQVSLSKIDGDYPVIALEVTTPNILTGDETEIVDMSDPDKRIEILAAGESCPE